MGSEVAKLLGKRIKELRKSLGITQIELAEKVDVDPKYVSRIETGISNPSLKTVEKISEIMNVDVARLFKPDEINEKNKIISKITERLHSTSLKNAQTIYEISEQIISRYQ